MARKRKISNLMGLAVLSTLAVNPMHRYEIAAKLRSWGKDRDMDIKWGSLYTVVDNLTKHGFLEITGSERDGARPERTIYRITEAGRAELLDWTRELVSTPEPEQRRFRAGLSVLAVLSPDEVIELLGQRIALLDKTIADHRAQMAALEGSLPRLFLVEDDYELAMLEAEAGWARRFRESLADGSFPDIEGWRSWHSTGVLPDEIVELMEEVPPPAD
ncbi:PadR family transcriptional regulator [Nocardia huaxiensis]|uniref:PadR family transcriptional regulator n=1 Tax=Nocardia huaxiensis TaxID=2755382 RepID=A0A7D6VAS7_9NOCA|nr:PadR family transcriptional regulator [Nocardia huaxiensis]QLY30631.1 PadR family transcriptional regulator [Nocardia huaxiensis]UFS95760.1 PadR family transcriptional regulator [Nocardia huaxiensis]